MLKIASLKLNNPLVCAPLAGVTNLPFRLMAKRHGAGLVCSEMISSNGLIRYQRKTMELMASKEEERPLSIQIFGSDPGVMADAARIAAEYGADIVDINCGCSVKKVLKGGAGSALMADLPKAEKILIEVRKAISLPFTIKMRSGWDASGEEAMALGKIAQDAGVDAVALHPRTAKQGFSGHSDWSLIKRLKQELSIPVIGNGDVTRPEHAPEMMDQTGCDGVMIGRAVLYAPWIFSQALCLLENKPLMEIRPGRPENGAFRLSGRHHGLYGRRARMPGHAKQAGLVCQRPAQRSQVQGGNHPHCVQRTGKRFDRGVFQEH